MEKNNKKELKQKKIKKNLPSLSIDPIFDNRFYKKNKYLNVFNYYNRNTIKMNENRKMKYKEHLKEEENYKKMHDMPKILYSNSFMDKQLAPAPILIQRRGNRSLDNILLSKPSKIICPITPNILDKEKIKNAIATKKNADTAKTSHFKKPLKIFDELFDCIDNLQVNTFSNLEEKEKNTFLTEGRDFSFFKNARVKELTDKINYQKTFTDQSKPLLISNANKHLYRIEDQIKEEPYINSNENLSVNSWNLSKSFNNSKKKFSSKINKIPKTNKINKATIITDNELYNQIMKNDSYVKNLLVFNYYGKYKFTEKGLDFPKNTYCGIPEYEGKDINERNFFNYHKSISNPKICYAKLNSFNIKFNNDLARISNTYGKEVSKGRFIHNPLINRYGSKLSNYSQYKEIKTIENRYLDKAKYRFKLVPLIDNKKKNFDKLGKIVYKSEYKKPGFFDP